MFGSNDGWEPSASTSPLFTSITANAPRPVPPGKRLLGGLLHAEVERQAQLAALLGVHLLQRLREVAERVHLHPGGPVAAAQEAVVLRLDAGLADAVAQLDAVVALVLELLLRDLAHLPEQVRADEPMRI